MRLDDASPRTWLLGAAAVWALAAWALALAGMGARIAPLPEDPSLLRPLPPLRPAAAERLGPLAQYGEIGARPLFSTDRRPKPFSLQGGADAEAQAAAFDYRLTSVLITPTLKMAILQPPDGSKSVRVRVGEAPESHPAWRLGTLNARSAVFEGPEGPRTLELRVFDGQGGQPPTPSAPTPATRETGGAAGTADAAVPPPRPILDPPRPAAGTAPATPAPSPPPSNAAPPASAPSTDQAQMEAIRQRIQARREQLRQQSQTQPPAK